MHLVAVHGITETGSEDRAGGKSCKNCHNSIIHIPLPQSCHPDLNQLLCAASICRKPTHQLLSSPLLMLVHDSKAHRSITDSQGADNPASSLSACSSSQRYRRKGKEHQLCIHTSTLDIQRSQSCRTSELQTQMMRSTATRCPSLLQRRVFKSITVWPKQWVLV